MSGSGTVDGDDLLLRLDLRMRLDEIADIEARRPDAQKSAKPSAKELRRLARKVYEERRLRNRVFEHRLFGEPAWDMLLALYFMPSNGEMLTVTSLSYAAGLSPATGCRWHQLLSAQGLIEPGPKSSDTRKKLVRLSASGKALMGRVLARLLQVRVRAQLDAP
jgi:DNA-binding MarR family transcriptional regulator